jgi:hypothetical protein
VHFSPDDLTRIIIVPTLTARLHDDLVHVAPYPVLARLKGPDERVRRGVEVPGGVPVLGTVATADVAADEALPEVHPRVAHLQALLAPVCAGFDVLDLV